MSVLGRLFGTEKAIENLTDKDNGLLAKAGSWVGGLHHTEEEKAEAVERTREWGLRQLEALEPFKVVQRILAFGVTFVWAFVALNVLVGIWSDALRNCRGIEDTCLPVTGQLLTFAFSNYVFWPVLAVLALYFTGGVLPNFVAKKK